MENEAKLYVVQLVLSIGYLHSENIIYKNLTPSNILMDEDGYLSLIDFGSNKIILKNE